MRTSRSLAGMAALFVGLGVAARPAIAFDLNGTWAGKISCKGLFNGAKQTVTITPTLIIDDGAALQLAADGVGYAAEAYPDAAHPEKGEIAIIRCDTSPTLSGAEFGGEFGRMKIGTKVGKTTGSLNGTTYKVSVLFAPSLFTCKWSFKRMTSARPSLGGCSQAPPA